MEIGRECVVISAQFHRLTWVGNVFRDAEKCVLENGPIDGKPVLRPKDSARKYSPIANLREQSLVVVLRGSHACLAEGVPFVVVEATQCLDLVCQRLGAFCSGLASQAAWARAGFVDCQTHC